MKLLHLITFIMLVQMNNDDGVLIMIYASLPSVGTLFDIKIYYLYNVSFRYHWLAQLHSL